MVYAKLYPATLVEEYRKTVRATYADFHGADSLRAPDAEEWRAVLRERASCATWARTCARCRPASTARAGWSAWAAAHAQPKKSAAPIFRRMLASHQRALERARDAGEPAGQIAARELEVQRISGALRRADELDDDVAAAIEAAPDASGQSG